MEMKMKHVTVAEMNDHCVTLVKSLGLLWVRVRGLPIDVAWVEPFESVAGRMDLTAVRRPSTGRVVVSRPVTDEQTYVIVLHEVGHVAHPNGRGVPRLPPWMPRIVKARESYYRMAAETAAWEWAYQTALCWTPAMEQVRLTCFSTYENELRRTK